MLLHVSPMKTSTKKIQSPSDAFSVSPISKSITHNEEPPTRDINGLFDRIMKNINQFAGKNTEQRSQEKMWETRRGPEDGGKKKENPSQNRTWSGTGLSLYQLVEAAGVEPS